MKVLEVKNLTKRYPGGGEGLGGVGRKKKEDFVAVDDISFSLEKGEIVGFLGPNGAGKTTTIQMLLGTLTPTEGEIWFFGERMTEVRRQKSEDRKSANRKKNASGKEALKLVNFASAYSDLPWRLTVWENLSWYAEIYEVPNKKERILRLLRELRAFDFLNKTINNLSAGEKTRVMLAKAFLNQPEIVLLDEPTASLDVEIAVEIRAYIKRMQKEFGTTVLLTSHNMQDVEELADRVIVINHGRIVDEFNMPISKQLEEHYVELIKKSNEESDKQQLVIPDNQIIFYNK